MLKAMFFIEKWVFLRMNDKIQSAVILSKNGDMKNRSQWNSPFGWFKNSQFKLVSYTAYLSPSNDLLTIPTKQKSTTGAALW